MNEHDATELAFKNGYKKAATEIFEDIESNMIDIKMEFVLFKAIGSKKLAKLKTKYTEDKT